mgnify:CR=1 FL=1
MKIIEKNFPSTQSHSLMPAQDTKQVFTDYISKTNSLDVYISFDTKTSLRAAIQAGNARFGVNHKSPYAKENKLKFRSVREMNYFSGVPVISDYFKYLKSQGKPELKKHIKSIIEEAFTHFQLTDYLDTLTVNLMLPSELL